MAKFEFFQTFGWNEGHFMKLWWSKLRKILTKLTPQNIEN